jgi:hypothetical protein
MAEELDFSNPEHAAGSHNGCFCAGANILLYSRNERAYSKS